MNNKAFQTSDQLAATYLQHLQALAFELSVAMDAIAANAITRLQESVAKQEMLCSVLATMVHTISETASLSGQPSLVVTDVSVEQNIQTTSRAISQLNLQYAALLRHSGRSIALLVSLCRSHTGQHLEAGGSRSKRQTWSCEM
jgi:hypothetical protein